MSELPIIQKTYDLIRWYVPILSCLPRKHRFTLGDRMVRNLYGLLEGLIQAQYRSEKLDLLQELNTTLDILRYQTRLLLDFDVIRLDRYERAGQLMQTVGADLGGWIKQQGRRRVAS